MSNKTRSPARRGTGTTQTSDDLVLRSIKSNKESNEKIGPFLQQLGELYFGVQQIEDLDPQELHSWIKFSTSVAKAQNNLSELAEVLKKAVEQELDADLRLLQAEVEDIERRRKADAKFAAKNQKRKEAQEDTDEKRREALFQEAQTERAQERDERSECHHQGIKERETRRKIYRVRESVLIGITVFCVLLAAFLIIFGVTHDKLIFIGGSGVSAIIAIGGFAKLVFGWGDPSPPSDDKANPLN
jgi:hypothetical protein